MVRAYKWQRQTFSLLYLQEASQKTKTVVLIPSKVDLILFSRHWDAEKI